MLPYYRLAHAVRHGCISDMREALAAGASLERPDATSLNLLELAQKHGQLEAARVLLQAGADPRAYTSPNGDSLIHKAIRTWQSAFVSLWLESGVAPWMANDQGVAPIHLAARYGEEYVIEQLVAAGASVLQPDKRGRTARMYAIESDQPTIVKRLVVLEAAALLSNNVDDNGGDRQGFGRCSQGGRDPQYSVSKLDPIRRQPNSDRGR